MGGVVKEVGNVVSEAIDGISDVIKTVWKAVGDDVLGIDDNKFFGIKGSIAKDFGSLAQDVFYDHINESVFYAIFAGGVYFSYIYGLKINIPNMIRNVLVQNDTNELSDMMYSIQLLNKQNQSTSMYHRSSSSGTMYEWLAGGMLYNEVQSGGELFDSINAIDMFGYIFGYPQIDFVAQRYKEEDMMRADLFDKSVYS